ncbi:hypothetical protein GIB67_027661 [Kingdonia uniflora]|uniref:Protein disulfide-isomerase n=1 Tax=Kingdonia uniflora TaxID=39325 RepID=A0A7J7NLB9_9MAGN|nr:hypothetical protein GIB67_027661 [Kingdonia uniflora]
MFLNTKSKSPKNKITKSQTTMAITTRILLSLFIATLFFTTIISATTNIDLDEDELSLLGEEEEGHHQLDQEHFGDDDDDEIDDRYGEGEEDGDELDDFEGIPDIDETDVVILKEGNFSEFVEKNRYVMVEFYAPWCGHCQSLAPEYAAAATELKDEGVKLAKIDATEENDLAHTYDVQGFPTVIFFVDGLHRPYPGQRTKEGIVTWVKKKTGPGIYNITSTEDAEHILKNGDKVVVGFLDSLVGSDSDELAAASRLEDDVNFYQTASADVAKLFQIDPKAKRPTLILLKKEVEKLSQFDGQFTKSAIAEFVFGNKLPLVTTFTRENAPLIFENPIKKQLLLFANSNDSEKLIAAYQEAAKLFKGKLIFVYVEIDNEDVGKPVSEYFGVNGDGPEVIAYTGNDDAKKFVFEGEVTTESIKAFGEDFLEDKLKPFFKSDPIPESNDEDVKVVVGNSFDEIVLDESKDVLLEIYAPWCGHCQSLEPIYNKLAKHLRGVESIVIAKMDGTANEHPRAKSDGFPTIVFFPAGNKSFDPITFDGDRTVVGLYKFLKKNAAIPFKLQKPASSKSEDAGVDATKSEDEDTDSNDLKDEL